MYVGLLEDGKYKVYIKGLEMMRPIRSFDDEDLMIMWVDDMNTSYEVGYDHGLQSPLRED